VATEAYRERKRFGPVTLPERLEFARADLEIYRINHFRPSYTAHVYLNAADSDELEPTSDSYAGSFSIFGHRRCYGDEGHCDVHEHLRRFDDRLSHPLTRAFKRVIITDALRRAVRSGARTVTITLDAHAPADEVAADEPLLDFEGLQIATFDA
jgi:hypothetical protein